MIPRLLRRLTCRLTDCRTPVDPDNSPALREAQRIEDRVTSLVERERHIRRNPIEQAIVPPRRHPRRAT